MSRLGGRWATGAFGLVIGLALLASPALAQTQPQNPLVLQPIENPVVFAPDVKITNIAHTTGVFVGGYAGVNLDQTFLIGAAGYWLVDPYDVIHMGYGGLLVGWRVAKSGAVSLAVRDLIGGGTATTYTLVAYPVVGPPNGGARHAYYPYGSYGYWTGFFITEPEVRAQIAIGTAVSVDAGIGYRVTSAGYGAYGSYGTSNQLNGVTGSVAVRFNFGQ